MFSSSFVDQNLILVDEWFYVCGESFGADQIDLLFQEFFKFGLVSKNFSPIGLL